MKFEPNVLAENGSYPEFTFAFQPIVDAVSHTVISYEALVRGFHGEGAYQVLGAIEKPNLPAFDADCRTVAINLATRLGIATELNLNLVPHNQDGNIDYLASTVRSANQNNLPVERVVLEITENELLGSRKSFADRMNEYRGLGIKLALDDFGAGYSGLNLLADFQPEQLKMDRELVKGIESSGPRQAIVRAVIQVCRDLGIDLVAEGVESSDEYHWLCDEGVRFFQGYFFAKPAFEALPAPSFPGLGK